VTKRIIFHCGSAKTGSTTIQNQLWENHALLEEKGIHYCPRFVRAGNIDPLNIHIRDIRFGDYEAAIKEGRERLHALFETGKIHTVIVSNESALGDPFHDRHDGFFPLLSRSLEGVSRMFEGFEVEPHFIVRSQASLLPSFYIQRVRQGATYGADAFYARAMQNALSWVPVIQKINTAFSHAKTKVHSFEQVIGQEMVLADALLKSTKVTSLEASADASKNFAANSTAVFLMRRMNRLAEQYAGLTGVPVAKAKNCVRSGLFGMIERYTVGGKVALPDQMREVLQKQYAADLAELG